MNTTNNNQEVGYVVSSRSYLAYLDGLPTVKINDIVQNDQGIRGIVHSLHPNKVEVLLLDNTEVIPGQLFKRTAETLSLSVGEFLLGRAVNPLGIPIDGKGLLASSKTNLLPLDRPARDIQNRQFITEQLTTGVTLVDSLVPIGKGQRELVIGDSHSGKTSFLLETIINQSKVEQQQTICIYASIGKPLNVTRKVIDTLTANNAMSYTIIVATSSAESAPLIFLTPQAAFTIAEYFQNQGKDVLIILDDMGTHAKIYREISLLGNKAPGRESYPGDIFYQQSRLLERAGKFTDDAGGGSITALPVIELNLNDFTTFIPTNLMAITDGHLLFKASLRNKGQQPAVDLGLSVSRVGRQTQTIVQSTLSRRIRQVLAGARELETVSRFSTELPLETQLILHQKDLLEEIIHQETLTFVPVNLQIIMLGLVFTDFLKKQNLTFLRQNKSKLIQAFQTDTTLKKLSGAIMEMKSDDELIKGLEDILPKLNQLFDAKEISNQ